MTDKTLVFTDGASRGNPGAGGWGAIIVEGNKITELGGNEPRTTNNRMEIAAAIGALEQIPKGAKVCLYTDSGYLVNGITKWIHGWQRNNWKTQAKQDVLNKELWQTLCLLASDRQIDWIQVKGHAGVPGNNRADEIATAFADHADISLYRGDRRNYDIPIGEPKKEELAADSDRERRNSKAYSYLSLIDGKLERHQNWADCETRVRGAKGAKFRKTISASDEAAILKSWGIEK